jgi:hypothetical protein
LSDHVRGGKCPECGGELGEPKKFNLMLRTSVGPMEDSSSVAYLRPETAQAIFADFDLRRHEEFSGTHKPYCAVHKRLRTFTSDTKHSTPTVNRCQAHFACVLHRAIAAG